MTIGGKGMSLLNLLFVFILASAVGYKIISDIPSMLHTPLMSGTNALSGITLLGALVITVTAVKLNSQLFGALAIASISSIRLL